MDWPWQGRPRLSFSSLRKLDFFHASTFIGAKLSTGSTGLVFSVTTLQLID